MTRHHPPLIILFVLAFAASAPLYAQTALPTALKAPTAPVKVDKADLTAGNGGTAGMFITVPTILSIPIGSSTDYFTASGAFQAGAEYCFGGRLEPFAGASIGYGFLPIRADASASMFSAEGEGGLGYWIRPRLAVRGSLGAGYWYAFMNDTGTGSGNFTVRYGLGVRNLLTPTVNLGFDADYRYQAGLYQGVELSAQVGIALSGREARKGIIAAAAKARYAQQGPKSPEKGRGIELANLSLGEIFPVFYKYYDDNPAGRVTLVNKEQAPIDGIKMTFFVKQFMDNPKECPAPESLAPGQRLDADIMALLSDRILEVTEATKVSGELVLDYRMGGEAYRDTRQVTLRILDRNAMTWDDDKRAAAFVTAKDPRVLSFAKQAVGISRDRGPQALDRYLLAAMAIYKQLDLYGVSYVVDPKTPFSELSASDTAVDFLQFPRQTLEYKAGDCDDLSILYAALLESVGMETAFVTVPGHIYLAFAAETSPADVKRFFSSEADLIVKDGKVWVPVEVTERREGFLKAWQTGAMEWREAVAQGTAALYPVHEAWKTYEPVGLPSSGPEIAIPPAADALAAFLKEASRLAEREMAPKARKLEELLVKQGDTPSLRNTLGVLYATYGFADRAEAEFGKAQSKGDHVPSLVNLGNLHFMRKDYERAREIYEKAATAAPDNGIALVNLAKAYRELDKPELAAQAYERLKNANPELAARYSFLSAPSGEGRAAEAKGPDVVWYEE